MKRTIIIVLILIIIGVGFYLGYQKSVKSDSSNPVVVKENKVSQNNSESIPIEPNLIIEPRVGVGKITFGMARDEVEQILGKPNQIDGQALVYPDNDMAVLVSKAAAVEMIILGYQNNPNEALIHPCLYKTSKGIGIESTLDEIKSAYGNPAKTQTQGQVLIVSYPKLGLEFDLVNNKVIRMHFYK